MTVINTTVASGFCCGCGVCAGICPEKKLVMTLNQYGEYNPILEDNCLTICGLCEKVCPFFDGNPNEDDLGKHLYSQTPKIQHRSETGYYLSSGAGYVSDVEHRLISASGGLATWFLEKLLIEDIVDVVIAVEHADDRRLFRFYSATTPSEVRAGSGSVYYPVEISEMFHQILRENKRYAIIGLPCVLKGIRLAQIRNSKLRERIVITIGLACSNLKSTHFTEYAAYEAEVSNSLSHVSFRQKPLTYPKNWFTFRFTDINGSITERPWGSPTSLWSMYLGRFCTLHSCDCCDDMHAELADVTFMDAWLPEYSKELYGTSLYISRTSLVDKVLAKGNKEGNITTTAIAIDKVILAQDSIHWKRDKLSYRLHLMIENGEQPPTKRVVPSLGKNLSILERDECRKCLDVQRESRKKTAIGYEGVGEWFADFYADRPISIKCCKIFVRIISMGMHVPSYILRKIRAV